MKKSTPVNSYLPTRSIGPAAVIVVAAIALVTLIVTVLTWTDAHAVRTRDDARAATDVLDRRLADQQHAAVLKALDTIDKRGQLTAIQIGEVKELVIKGGR